MAAAHLEAKAHELIAKLDSDRLAAVVHLLEVLVRDTEEDEQISAEEEAAVARSRQWFQSHTGIPFDQVVADLGFTMDEVREAAKDPAA